MAILESEANIVNALLFAKFAQSSAALYGCGKNIVVCDHGRIERYS